MHPQGGRHGAPGRAPTSGQHSRHLVAAAAIGVLAAGVLAVARAAPSPDADGSVRFTVFESFHSPG
jgi:hypothetical protein